MEQEIWHDDLYATRTTPVKPRQNNHKSRAKFASEHKMIVSVFAEAEKNSIAAN